MRNILYYEKYLLMWVLLLGCLSTIWAQKNVSEITGTVLDENKEPLIGVNIVIKITRDWVPLLT